jgi:hypothetical protein
VVGRRPGEQVVDVGVGVLVKPDDRHLLVSGVAPPIPSIWRTSGEPTLNSRSSRSRTSSGRSAAKNRARRAPPRITMHRTSSIGQPTQFARLSTTGPRGDRLIASWSAWTTATAKQSRSPVVPRHQQPTPSWFGAVIVSHRFVLFDGAPIGRYVRRTTVAGLHRQ